MYLGGRRTLRVFWGLKFLGVFGGLGVLEDGTLGGRRTLEVLRGRRGLRDRGGRWALRVFGGYRVL